MSYCLINNAGKVLGGGQTNPVETEAREGENYKKITLKDR